MLVGQGARGCVDELTKVADLLGAGAPRPFWEGRAARRPALGHRIHRPARHHRELHLMRDCDTLLTVGSNFPYSQFLPEFDQARAVQIDRSGKWIGMRYPYELNIVGDAEVHAAALIPLLHRKNDRVLAGDRSSSMSPVGGRPRNGRR